MGHLWIWEWWCLWLGLALAFLSGRWWRLWLGLALAFLSGRWWRYFDGMAALEVMLDTGYRGRGDKARKI